MSKFFALIVVVILSTLSVSSVEARRKSLKGKATAYIRTLPVKGIIQIRLLEGSRGAKVIPAVGMRLGVVHWKTLKRDLTPLIKKYIGDVESIRVIALTDAYSIQGTKYHSKKDDRGNGALSIARAQAALVVIRKFVSFHNHSVRMSVLPYRHNKVDPNYRGVEISLYKTPPCTQEEVEKADFIREEIDTARVYTKKKHELKIISRFVDVQELGKIRLMVLRFPVGNLYDTVERKMVRGKRSTKCFVIVKNTKALPPLPPPFCDPNKGLKLNQQQTSCICKDCPEGMKRKSGRLSDGSCHPCKKDKGNGGGGEEPSKPSVSDWHKGIGLAGLIGNHAICGDVSRTYHFGLELSYKFNDHLGINFGSQSVSAKVLEDGFTQPVAKRIAMMTLGVEASVAVKDLPFDKLKTSSLANLRIGIKGGVFFNLNSQLPSLGAFVRMPFDSGWFVEARAEAIWYGFVHESDPTAEHEVGNTINVAILVGKRF